MVSVVALLESLRGTKRGWDDRYIPQWDGWQLGCELMPCRRPCFDCMDGRAPGDKINDTYVFKTEVGILHVSGPASTASNAAALSAAAAFSAAAVARSPASSASSAANAAALPPPAAAAADSSSAHAAPVTPIPATAPATAIVTALAKSPRRPVPATVGTEVKLSPSSEAAEHAAPSGGAAPARAPPRRRTEGAPHFRDEDELCR